MSNKDRQVNDAFTMEGESEVPEEKTAKRTTVNADPVETPQYGHQYSVATGMPELRLITKFKTYCRSQKGKELTVGTSILYTMTLGIVGFSILLSQWLPPRGVTEITTAIFFICMYSLSMSLLVVLLVLGALKMLTADDSFKHLKKTNFVRGGMFVLGSGGIVYRFTEIVTYIISPDHCRSDVNFVHNIVSVAFMASQMTFLIRYCKVHINSYFALAFAGRYLIMQVVATNLCVWLQTVIVESVHELDYLSGGHLEEYTELNNSTQNATDDICATVGGLSHIMTPYTFPLLIEFSVVSSGMMLVVWEKCGMMDESSLIVGSEIDSSSGRQEGTFSTSEHVSVNPADSMALGTTSETLDVTSANTSSHTAENGASLSHFYNTNTGFVLGWAVILASIVIIIAVLYEYYSDLGMGEYVEAIVYSTNIAIHSMILICIPITMKRMAHLTWKDEEIKELRHHGHKRMAGFHLNMARHFDKHLLTLTFLSTLALKVFIMISAYIQNEQLVMWDAVLSLLMGYVQTIFINWYAYQKRSTEEKQRRLKPGRQGMDFLRCCNFSLWIVNTFLLKHYTIKQIHVDTFGTTGWVILSNVFQPLNILYYFHSMICLAEVITHCYTDKYVGLVRPAKKRRYTVISFVDEHK